MGTRAGLLELCDGLGPALRKRTHVQFEKVLEKNLRDGWNIDFFASAIISYKALPIFSMTSVDLNFHLFISYILNKQSWVDC